MAIHVREKLKAAHTPFDLFAEWLARFTGSWSFIILHVLWFGVWFLFRLDINLLTLVVSLEAIFLMTILLMAANRHAEHDAARDDADYEADVHAEKEIHEVKQILLSIERKLNDKRKRE